MNRKTLLQIKLIRHGENPETRRMIQAIDQYQASLITPRNFNPRDPDNYLQKVELSFENLLTSLEELGVTSPENLTVFRFYSKIQYFKKKERNKSKKT